MGMIIFFDYILLAQGLGMLVMYLYFLCSKKEKPLADRRSSALNGKGAGRLEGIVEHKFIVKEQVIPDCCSICLGDFEEKDDLFTMSCHSTHTYHRMCIKDWLKRAPFCPLCNRKTTQEVINSL